jgi:1,4-dihydroxy-2-naphthoate octaprenyltransferase
LLAEGAHGLGLTAEEVAGQLRASMLGEIADTQRIGQWDIEILIRQAEQDRQSLDDLAHQTVRLPDGRRVPLEVVARMEEARDWARITHIDGRRSVIVEANVDARSTSAQAIVADMRSDWLDDFRARHPDITVTFEGQVARSAQTGGSIGRGLLIGLIGIFIILSFQFRGYIEPLIVMVSIPLAFIGALWGHVLMGYYLSMPSLLGAASLAGIVVNNAILLIQFIKVHREKGLSAAAAAGQASRDRLRSVLIATSTTIAGLLPVLVETSAQAAAIKPVVISVVFGLLTSTVLVLLVMPALYVLFADWGWARLPGVIVIVLYTRWLTRDPLLCLLAPGIGFGPCMVMGVDFVMTGTYGAAAFAASLTPLFLVSNLLLINQFPDIVPDAGVGRRHLMIVYGKRAGVIIYGVFLAGSYLSVVVAWLAGWFPAPALAALLTAPLAVHTAAGVAKHHDSGPASLLPYMGRNVVITLATPALLAAGLFAGGFFFR